MDISIGGCRGWNWQAGRAKKRFMDAVEEDGESVGVREEDAEDHKLKIHCGHP